MIKLFSIYKIKGFALQFVTFSMYAVTLNIFFFLKVIIDDNPKSCLLVEFIVVTPEACNLLIQLAILGNSSKLTDLFGVKQ